MLGPLLRVCEQAFSIGGILDRAFAARARPGNRPDRHFTVASAHQYFGAGPDQCKSGEVEIIEERRRIDPPQRAIQGDRRQCERTCEALRQDHLKGVPDLTRIVQRLKRNQASLKELKA